MSAFSDLESLIALTSSLDNGKLNEVYSSVATHIASQGAAKAAQAITELQSIGVDPTMYIPPTEFYQRRQRELLRMEPERLAAQQQQDRHDVAMERERLELRKLAAEVELAEGAAKRINA